MMYFFKGPESKRDFKMWENTILEMSLYNCGAKRTMWNKMLCDNNKNCNIVMESINIDQDSFLNAIYQSKRLPDGAWLVQGLLADVLQFDLVQIKYFCLHSQ